VQDLQQRIPNNSWRSENVGESGSICDVDWDIHGPPPSSKKSILFKAATCHLKCKMSKWWSVTNQLWNLRLKQEAGDSGMLHCAPMLMQNENILFKHMESIYEARVSVIELQQETVRYDDQEVESGAFQEEMDRLNLCLTIAINRLNTLEAVSLGSLLDHDHSPPKTWGDKEEHPSPKKPRLPEFGSPPPAPVKRRRRAISTTFRSPVRPGTRYRCQCLFSTCSCLK
jgi:hypothetical protein